MSEDVRASEGAERVREHLHRSAEIKYAAASRCSPAVADAAFVIAEAFRAGHKLLLCGNGGSAADCQHMAAEFTSRLYRERDRPGLPALALTTDTSFLTAYANDCGYEGVFARQVQALGLRGDVLLGISTSGGSRNVLLAAETARSAGMKVIALMGAEGPLANLADVTIAVPSTDTQNIQETHLAIEHAICELVETRLFGQLRR